MSAPEAKHTAGRESDFAYSLRTKRCRRCYGAMEVRGGCAPEMAIEYDDEEEYIQCVDCGVGFYLGIAKASSQ